MTRSFRNCLGFAVGLLAVSILAISMGCTSVQSFFNSPQSKPVIDAVVLVAVATAETKGVPAEQINKVAKAALAADTGVAGSLAAISALVDQAIAQSGLPAADLAAAKILEVALGAAITAKIGNNQDLAAAQADVAVVLNSVIAASGG